MKLRLDRTSETDELFAYIPGYRTRTTSQKMMNLTKVMQRMS